MSCYRLKYRRSAYTLLEVILASSMLTLMVTATAVILRGSQMAWLAHESDLAEVEEAAAVLRHVVRHVRQAQAVLAITPEQNPQSSLSVLMPDGQTHTWTYWPSSSSVRFNTGAGDQLLAEGIAAMSFVGYQRDTITKTTTVADIRLIEARVTVQRAQGNETYSCRAWLRSW